MINRVVCSTFLIDLLCYKAFILASINPVITSTTTIIIRGSNKSFSTQCQTWICTWVCVRPRKRVTKAKVIKIMWHCSLLKCAFQAQLGAEMMHSHRSIPIICCHSGRDHFCELQALRTRSSCSGWCSLHSRAEGNDRITVCSALLSRCAVTVRAGVCQGQKPVSGSSTISPLNPKKFQLPTGWRRPVRGCCSCGSLTSIWWTTLSRDGRPASYCSSLMEEK